MLMLQLNVLFFIKSILKSLVILAMWSALSGSIYSQIALSFALNHIFFSANENGTVKQNNQSDFKAFLNKPVTLQENERQNAIVWQIWWLGSINIGTDQNLDVNLEHCRPLNSTPLSSITIIHREMLIVWIEVFQDTVCREGEREYVHNFHHFETRSILEWKLWLNDYVVQSNVNYTFIINDLASSLKSLYVPYSV